LIAGAVVAVALIVGLAIGGSSEPQQPHFRTRPYVTFDEGTYRVGPDVAPGVYEGEPLPDARACYYARLNRSRDPSESTDVIAHDTFSGKKVITIDPTDKYFETNNCQWRRV